MVPRRSVAAHSGHRAPRRRPPYRRFGGVGAGHGGGAGVGPCGRRRRRCPRAAPRRPRGHPPAPGRRGHPRPARGRVRRRSGNRRDDPRPRRRLGGCQDAGVRHPRPTGERGGVPRRRRRTSFRRRPPLAPARRPHRAVAGDGHTGDCRAGRVRHSHPLRRSDARAAAPGVHPRPARRRPGVHPRPARHAGCLVRPRPAGPARFGPARSGPARSGPARPGHCCPDGSARSGPGRYHPPSPGSDRHGADGCVRFGHARGGRCGPVGAGGRRPGPHGLRCAATADADPLPTADLATPVGRLPGPVHCRLPGPAGHSRPAGPAGHSRPAGPAGHSRPDGLAGHCGQADRGADDRARAGGRGAHCRTDGCADGRGCGNPRAGRAGPTRPTGWARSSPSGQ